MADTKSPKPAKSEAGSSGPNPLTDLIAAEVTREEDRRQDFRTRSVSLLSVSSGILAVATSLLALADKVGGSTYQLTTTSRTVVIAAVAALVLSAGLALWVNASAHDYDVSKTACLDEMVKNHWNDPQLAQTVAGLDISYLTRLRGSNELKKWIFDFSIGFQIVGVALIATTALLVLTNT